MISFSVLFYFSSLSNSFISLLRNTDRIDDLKNDEITKKREK